MAAKADVHVRFTRKPDTIYLDLCDDQWRAVEITARGWRVIDSPPVLFRRPNGAQALPVPLPGGNLEDLRPRVVFVLVLRRLPIGDGAFGRCAAPLGNATEFEFGNRNGTRRTSKTPLVESHIRRQAASYAPVP
jgi:hypothetical protein